MTWAWLDKLFGPEPVVRHSKRVWMYEEEMIEFQWKFWMFAHEAAKSLPDTRENKAALITQAAEREAHYNALRTPLRKEGDATVTRKSEEYYWRWQ